MGTLRLPDRIRYLRERLGLTQAELAERIGVRDATVSDWERGTAKPRTRSLRALAELTAQPGEWRAWLKTGEGNAPRVDWASDQPDPRLDTPPEYPEFLRTMADYIARGETSMPLEEVEEWARKLVRRQKQQEAKEG